jgi:hypothetical protein
MANLSDASFVCMTLAEYDALKAQADEAKKWQVIAHEREGSAVAEQLEGVHASEIECLNSHLEAAHEARRKAENAMLAMRSDYELGRLVRAMPFWMLCRHSEDSWTMGYGIHVTDYCKTPEEALRLGCAGETPEPAPPPNVAATEHVLSVQPFCPATADHCCPKATDCFASCALDTAVKS